MRLWVGNPCAAGTWLNLRARVTGVTLALTLIECTKNKLDVLFCSENFTKRNFTFAFLKVEEKFENHLPFCWWILFCQLVTDLWEVQGEFYSKCFSLQEIRNKNWKKNLAVTLQLRQQLCNFFFLSNNCCGNHCVTCSPAEGLPDSWSISAHNWKSDMPQVRVHRGVETVTSHGPSPGIAKPRWSYGTDSQRARQASVNPSEWMNKTGARVHRFFRWNSFCSREPGRNPKGRGIKVPLNPACSGRPGGRWGWSLEGTPLSRDRFRSRGHFAAVHVGWFTMVGTGGKVVDRDENRAKSQNSTTLGFPGQHERRGGNVGHADDDPSVERRGKWTRSYRWPCGSLVSARSRRASSESELGPERSALVGLRNVRLTVSQGSTSAEASVRGAASKLSSPSEPVSYGLVQFKCCVQCWLIIVYESRLLFVCLQYYCLKHTDYKSKLCSGLNNEI